MSSGRYPGGVGDQATVLQKLRGSSLSLGHISVYSIRQADGAPLSPEETVKGVLTVQNKFVQNFLLIWRFKVSSKIFKRDL